MAETAMSNLFGGFVQSLKSRECLPGQILGNLKERTLFIHQFSRFLLYLPVAHRCNHQALDCRLRLCESSACLGKQVSREILDGVGKLSKFFELSSAGTSVALTQSVKQTK